MKNCVLCYNEFTKECNSHLKLFELCRLYLHSSVAQGTSKTVSEERNFPFCSKCLESATKLNKLSNQLQCIQKSVSEFTFSFGLEILHRRGQVILNKTDENAEHYYSIQKSAEFDVSTFSNGNICSQPISNCPEALLNSTSEDALLEIVDEIDPLEIPLVIKEVRTSGITFETIKIENSEQSPTTPLYDEIRLENAASENIIQVSSNAKTTNNSLTTNIQCNNLIPTVKLVRLPSKPNEYGKTDGDLIIPAAPKSPPIASSVFASSAPSTPLKRKTAFSNRVDEQGSNPGPTTSSAPTTSPARRIVLKAVRKRPTVSKYEDYIVSIDGVATYSKARKEHLCKLCEPPHNTFATKETAVAHWRLRHGPNAGAKIPCKFCNKKYPGLRGLQQHYKHCKQKRKLNAVTEEVKDAEDLNSSTASFENVNMP